MRIINKFAVLGDNDELIITADTLNDARNQLDAHVKAEYGSFQSRLGMRNYGAEKDAAGLWSERMELRLGAYSTRMFTVLMPAGWDAKDYHVS